MPRILRVRTMTSGPKGAVKRPGPQISKWDVLKQVPRNMKQRVRRLHRVDPANAMTQDNLFDQFTNNPNLKHQPTGVGAQSASRKDGTPPRPRPSTAGHDQVVRAPRKVLRDRTNNDKPISGT